MKAKDATFPYKNIPPSNPPYINFERHILCNCLNNYEINGILLSELMLVTWRLNPTMPLHDITYAIHTKLNVQYDVRTIYTLHTIFKFTEQNTHQNR